MSISQAFGVSFPVGVEGILPSFPTPLRQPSRVIPPERAFSKAESSVHRRRRGLTGKRDGEPSVVIAERLSRARMRQIELDATAIDLYASLFDRVTDMAQHSPR